MRLNPILLTGLILTVDELLGRHIQIVLVLGHLVIPLLHNIHIQIVLVATRLNVCIE